MRRAITGLCGRHSLVFGYMEQMPREPGLNSASFLYLTLQLFRARPLSSPLSQKPCLITLPSGKSRAAPELQAARLHRSNLNSRPAKC